MKNQILIASLVLLVIATSCGRRVDTKSAPETSLDSFSYIVGNQVGNYMKTQGIDKLSYGALIKGIEEAMKKDSGFAIHPDSMDKIQTTFVMREQEKKIKVIQEETKKWMADNAKKPGVSYLPSKGQFKELKKGTGAVAGENDTVVYHLRAVDTKGKVKGDSRERGVAPREVIRNIYIAPIREAFEKVAEGATFEVYIQNDVFMGGAGSRESIESRFGVTVFTIELLKVIPGTAPAESAEPQIAPAE